MEKITLEQLLSSIIRQQRKKSGGYSTEFLFLTPKQTYFFNNVMRQRVFELEKKKVWSDENFQLCKDGAGIYQLIHKRWNWYIEFPKIIKDKKSMARVVRDRATGKLSSVWFNCEGWSILRINKFQRL